jgi:hypothetical protein
MTAMVVGAIDHTASKAERVLLASIRWCDKNNSSVIKFLPNLFWTESELLICLRESGNRSRLISRRANLRNIVLCVAAGLLIASSSNVFAGGHGSASSVSPGHEFKPGSNTTVTPVPGLHGAAGYAPGQQMLHPTGTVGNTSAPGNGAAVYAPGFLK